MRGHFALDARFFGAAGLLALKATCPFCSALGGFVPDEHSARRRASSHKCLEQSSRSNMSKRRVPFPRNAAAPILSHYFRAANAEQTPCQLMYIAAVSSAHRIADYSETRWAFEPKQNTPAARGTTNCSDAPNTVLDARANGIIFSIYLVRSAWPIGDANV